MKIKLKTDVYVKHIGIQVLDDYVELRPFLLVLECFTYMACSAMNDSETWESPC